MVRYLFKSGAQDSAHRKHVINGGSSAIQDWLKDLGLQPLGFSKSLMLLFITVLSIWSDSHPIQIDLRKIGSEVEMF